MKIFVTDFSGTVHELEGLAGWRAMEVIRDWGLPIKAECEGCLSCATCHVYVSEQWVSGLAPITPEEEEMLDDAFEVKSNSRLSCQIILSDELDGLCLTMAPGSKAD